MFTLNENNQFEEHRDDDEIVGPQWGSLLSDLLNENEESILSDNNDEVTNKHVLTMETPENPFNENEQQNLIVYQKTPNTSKSNSSIERNNKSEKRFTRSTTSVLKMLIQTNLYC